MVGKEPHVVWCPNLGTFFVHMSSSKDTTKVFTQHFNSSGINTGFGVKGPGFDLHLCCLPCDLGYFSSTSLIFFICKMRVKVKLGDLHVALER